VGVATVLQPGPTAGRALESSADVIAAAQLGDPAPYYDLGPHGGALPGLTVLRPYPPGSPPAEVVNARGEPVYVCVVGLRVEPPSPREAPAALARYGRQAQLTPVTFDRQFRYEIASGRFFGPGRAMTVREILDFAYEFHLRTRRWAFRVRRSVWRHFINPLWAATGPAQSTCIWLLGFLYGIATEPSNQDGRASLLYDYAWKDFAERKEAAGHSFQGFVGPPRRILWNLGAVLTLGGVVYWNRPSSGVLNRIIDNETLALAALAVAYLAVDQLGSGLLKLAVIALSRLRRWTVDKGMNVDVRSA
jgi:hypothetical protein